MAEQPNCVPGGSDSLLDTARAAVSPYTGRSKNKLSGSRKRGSCTSGSRAPPRKRSCLNEDLTFNEKETATDHKPSNRTHLDAGSKRTNSYSLKAQEPPVAPPRGRGRPRKGADRKLASTEREALARPRLTDRSREKATLARGKSTKTTGKDPFYAVPAIPLINSRTRNYAGPVKPAVADEPSVPLAPPTGGNRGKTSIVWATNTGHRAQTNGKSSRSSSASSSASTVLVADRCASPKTRGPKTQKPPTSTAQLNVPAAVRGEYLNCRSKTVHKPPVKSKVDSGLTVSGLVQKLPRDTKSLVGRRQKTVKSVNNNNVESDCREKSHWSTAHNGVPAKPQRQALKRDLAAIPAALSHPEPAPLLKKYPLRSQVRLTDSGAVVPISSAGASGGRWAATVPKKKAKVTIQEKPLAGIDN